MKSDKPKVLVILGPTATGKSDLAVKLAKEFNGEIISADSRQVYRGLDIGTAKITEKEMQGVPHHLLDVADPSERFTVANWRDMADKAVADIRSRGKLPIIVGGTGFYISAFIDRLLFPEVEADPDEQIELENKSAPELFEELMRLDPRRAKAMKDAGKGEATNKRRLARAILIARVLGSVPDLQKAVGSSPVLSDPRALQLGGVPLHPNGVLQIGLMLPDEELKQRIKKRLISRIDKGIDRGERNGLIEEAEHLHKPHTEGGAGLSFQRMNELGLEYRYLAEFLQGHLNEEQLIDTLSTKIWQFARRQKTWFKRDKRIHWFDPSKEEEVKEIFNLTKVFIDAKV